MDRMNRPGKKKPVSLWISAVVIAIVVAVGVVYTVLPLNNLRGLLGMEKEAETVHSGESWESLLASRKKLLAPLESEWNGLSAAQKRKWLEVAGKMEKMSPEEKQRFQNHIRDWLNLTPEQRRMARQNFLGFKKLNPVKKTEKWKEYQQLPEERKRALAEKARSRRRLTSLADETVKQDVVVDPPVRQPEKVAQPPVQDEIPEYWR